MPRIAVRLENDPQLTPADSVELAQLAESRGYEMVWVPEGSGRDSLTQLAFLACHTGAVKLATGILPVYYRTPMLTAMSAAGLSDLSQGRFVLGLGVGHRPSVEGIHGIRFRRPLAHMRETITLVRSLLDGERVSLAGRVFNVDGASLGAAAPEQRTPIYVAALGPQMLELTGELADGVLLNWTASNYLERAIHHLRRGAEKAGRDPSEIDVAGLRAGGRVRGPGNGAGQPARADCPLRQQPLLQQLLPGHGFWPRDERSGGGTRGGETWMRRPGP